METDKTTVAVAQAIPAAPTEIEQRSTEHNDMSHNDSSNTRVRDTHEVRKSLTKSDVTQAPNNDEANTRHEQVIDTLTDKSRRP